MKENKYMVVSGREKVLCYMVKHLFVSPMSYKGNIDQAMMVSEVLTQILELVFFIDQDMDTSCSFNLLIKSGDAYDIF